METTKLSTLLNRMDRWKTLYDTEEQYKVRDLDSAIRVYKRKFKFPWNLKKSSLKVFDDVFEYPMEDDHDGLAYLENPDNDSNLNNFNGTFKTLKQFLENEKRENSIAEIWDGGDKYLGVRNNNINLTSSLIDSASDTDDYSYSGDITSIGEETVNVKEGTNSIRVNITNSIDTATLVCSPSAISDSNYKQKYFFIYVYMPSVPTSVELKYGNDSTNCLYEEITKQFAGQTLKAGQWNLLAFDLNSATEEGSLDSSNFDYFSIIFNGAATGVYYVDSSYLRKWTLMDYYYYSSNSIKTEGYSVANQEYFHDSDELYEITSELVCDNDFADLIMYEAILMAINEKENPATYGQINGLKQEAWNAIKKIYPSLEYSKTDSYYNFINI